MSRYDWPLRARGAKGRRPHRAAWNLSREAGTNLAGAVTVPAGQTTAAEPTPEPPARLAPDGPAELWQPLGPTTTLDGTNQREPRTAGRCRDIAVNPAAPQRIYVASANGGLWYSESSGA